MKKLMTIFIAFITIFITISSSAFAVQLGGTELEKADVFQSALADLNMEIGDSFVRLINNIAGEDVTIQKIVFNHLDSVNPNFFDESIVDKVSATSIVRDTVTKWYNFFMILAVASYVICLLIIGIRVLTTDVASALSKAKEMFTKWLVGIMILFLFPIVIKYVFKINEAIVNMIESASNAGANGGVSGNNTDWSTEEPEFRSPEYVSSYTFSNTILSAREYNKIQKNRLDIYRQNLDMVKIMRAYAGITKKLIYVIIWLILFWQTVVMLVKYYKRYFIIALLITIFPLVCLWYVIEIARGKNGQVFSTWSKELFVNIMIQSVHAVIYSIIASVVLDRIRADILKDSDNMNWLLIIVTVNFLSEGEKIVRKILGMEASTVSGIGATAGAMRGKAKEGISNTKKIANNFRHKGK